MTETTNTLNLLSRRHTVQQCMSHDREGLIALEFLDLTVKSDETATMNLPPTLDNIRIELENVKIEEHGQSEEHRNLSANYDLLEDLLDRIAQHVDCSILEMKSSEGLMRALESFARNWSLVDESWVAPSISKLERLDLIKDRLVATLDEQGEMQSLRQKYEESRGNLRLAIKNFKIVLEVVDLDASTLKKLRRQFVDVTSRYTASYRSLKKEMFSVFSERMQILRECLELLANDGMVWIENRKRMREVLVRIGRDLKEDNVREHMKW